MPAGKTQQSSAMFYTLITFVGLFIIATAISVIYYIKAEKYRTKAATPQSRLEEMATSAELREIGVLIGAKESRKSRIGTMLDYLDEMVYLIIGGLPEEASAEVKVDTAHREVKDILDLLAREYPDIGNVDPNTTGLIRIIEKLKMELDNTTNTRVALKEQFEQLQNRFDDVVATSFEKEQTLLAEKEKHQRQVNDITQNYNKLKLLMEQTSEQQVRNLMAQLDEERANHKKLNQELLKTQAELKMAQDGMKRAQEKLQTFVPPPDTEVAAYKSDGKIILIDDQTKIVHLDIGSNDHVYRGLTFSVYDKNIPIPRDGKGKAEVEVFNVGKNISAARITRSEMKSPIVLNDIVANLIWDSDKVNVFVVAGDFDLDNDGNIDYGAVGKIKALIEEWGGRVADIVSIDTDFVVLGRAPQVLKRPAFEQMEVDPMAMEKYKASLQKLISYNEVLTRSKDLGIPIFNAERFLYFIGYKAQTDRPGAF